MLVICDAHDGVTSQDLRIAEMAMKAGCATALVLNKWDLTSGDDFDLDHERARVAEKLQREPVEDFRADFEDGYGTTPADVAATMTSDG